MFDLHLIERSWSPYLYDGTGGSPAHPDGPSLRETLTRVIAGVEWHTVPPWPEAVPARVQKFAASLAAFAERFDGAEITAICWESNLPHSLGARQELIGVEFLPGNATVCRAYGLLTQLTDTATAFEPAVLDILEPTENAEQSAVITPDGRMYVYLAKRPDAVGQLRQQTPAANRRQLRGGLEALVGHDLENADPNQPNQVAAAVIATLDDSTAQASNPSTLEHATNPITGAVMFIASGDSGRPAGLRPEHLRQLNAARQAALR